MTGRAASVDSTRRQIVRAAMTLQAELGSTAVRWEDIAERAGVHPATVYRHFPSLDELVPACVGWIFEKGMPTAADAENLFAGIDSPGDRFEKLVRESCRCYGLAPGWLAVARGSREATAALQKAAQEQVDAVGVLVRGALGRPVDIATEATFRALVDFPFWRSLCEAGMQPLEATEAVVALVRERLRASGLEEWGV